VAAVAVPKIFGGAFEQQNISTGPACGHRGTQGGITAAHDQNVEGLR
jgi:hypothetical protein